METQRHIGIDLHRHQFTCCVRLENGRNYLTDWKLDDAFFMVGSVDGGEEAKVKASKKVFKKGDKAKISIDLGKNEIDQSLLEKANLTRSLNGEKASVLDEVKFAIKEDELTGNFTVPTKPGVYNLSFDVTGINEDGEPFTRSINYNFAVTDRDGEIE